MTYTLRKHLEQLCSQNKDLEPLLAQWVFDEKLISKALQNINLTFPHYSLHDSSHSYQILTQIERILGEERLKKLSATDTWLLLESAYLHDIGMVIPDQLVKETWNNKDFQNYLTRISENITHELYEYVNLVKGNTLDKNSNNWPLEVSKAMVFIMSDFFRPKHPDLSSEIIKSPQIISLNTPRNELVPSRFIHILAAISAHHGKYFDDVMKLPYLISGFSTEDAHPRFIACLLRLGDLLDLDSNRFCPVLLSTIGLLPLSSQAHYDKHSGIINLRVDSRKIDVEAICDSYESYGVTKSWFSWIEDELKNQSTHWTEIVPDKDFGLLPNIGELNIQIKNVINLEQNIRPKFDVDLSSVMEIFQGTGIYNSKFVFVREAIQNAIDTSALSLWNDIKTGRFEFMEYYLPEIIKEKIALKEVEPEDLKEIFKLYPINLFIYEEKDDSDNKDHVHWKFTITDNGLGINLKDINYMKSVGSSHKNTLKNDLIKDMPEWLKPSGIFGLGIHSYFMVTDKIQFTTKSKINNEKLILNMHNFLGKGMGNIIIQRYNEESQLNYGTKLEFDIKLEKIPQLTKLHYDEKNYKYRDMAKNFLLQFDPAKDKKFNYEIAEILKSVDEFSLYSLFPIYLNNTRINEKNYLNNNSKFIFDIKTNVYIKINPGNYIEYSKTYFRGQFIDQFFSRYPFLHLEINLMCGSAKKFLNINREKVLENKKEDLNTLIETVIKNTIPIYSKQIIETDEEDKKKLLSLFIFIYQKKMNFQGIPSTLRDLWKGVNIANTNYKFEDILNQENINIIEFRRKDTGFSVSFNIDASTQNTMNITIGDYSSDTKNYEEMIFAVLDEHFYLEDLSVIKEGNSEKLIYSYTKNKTGLKINNLPLIVDEIYSWMRGGGSFSRFTIPCLDKYQELSFEEEDNKQTYCNRVLYKCKNRFILPFFISGFSIQLINMIEFYNWVKQIINRDIEIERIKSLYKDFIIEFDKILRNNEDYRYLISYDIKDI